jgi:histidinol-phosphate aminotransferase
VPVGADLRLDLDAMLARSLGAGLVYVCNPNNPTGTAHPKAAVEEFVRRVLTKAPAAHVMVDEAYFEYADLPGFDTLAPMALDDPRVFVLRTFSKVHGMAGLRVGYALGKPETIAALSRFRLPIGVNALGAAAARASIGDRPHLAREVKLNSEARAFTRGFFERAGYACGASQTNFLMVAIRRPIADFRAACEKKGVAIGRNRPAVLH